MFATQFLLVRSSSGVVYDITFLHSSGLQRLVQLSCVVYDITVLAWQWIAAFLDEPWGGSLYLPRTVDVVVQHSRLRCD